MPTPVVTRRADFLGAHLFEYLLETGALHKSKLPDEIDSLRLPPKMLAAADSGCGLPLHGPRIGPGHVMWLLQESPLPLPRRVYTQRRLG